MSCRTCLFRKKQVRVLIEGTGCYMGRIRCSRGEFISASFALSKCIWQWSQFCNFCGIRTVCNNWGNYLKSIKNKQMQPGGRARKTATVLYSSILVAYFGPQRMLAIDAMGEWSCLFCIIILTHRWHYQIIGNNTSYCFVKFMFFVTYRVVQLSLYQINQCVDIVLINSIAYKFIF